MKSRWNPLQGIAIMVFIPQAVDFSDVMSGFRHEIRRLFENLMMFSIIDNCEFLSNFAFIDN